MKNIKLLILASAAVLAMTLRSSADVYTDTNTHNEFMTEGDTVNGQWSYGPIGAGEVITKVETWFRFHDSDSADEKYMVAIGTGEGPVDFSFTSGIIELGNGFTANWAFTSNASLFDDASNGLLSYSVTAVNVGNLSNDFYFDWAKVEVTTRSAPDSGATIALLSLGVIAMVGAQRKLRLQR